MYYSHYIISALRSFHLLVLFLALIQCNSATKKSQNSILNDSLTHANMNLDHSGQNKKCYNCKCFSNKSSIWKIEIDSFGKEYLVRGDSIDYFKSNIISLINEINKHKSVKLKLVKLKNKTIYVKILNSTLLTQRMGTDGANSYLAVVVYTLTEYSNYKKVYLDFIGGDHGGEPGLRSRSYFIDIFKECPLESHF